MYNMQIVAILLVLILIVVVILIMGGAEQRKQNRRLEKERKQAIKEQKEEAKEQREEARRQKKMEKKKGYTDILNANTKVEEEPVEEFSNDEYNSIESKEYDFDNTIKESKEYDFNDTIKEPEEIKLDDDIEESEEANLDSNIEKQEEPKIEEKTKLDKEVNHDDVFLFDDFEKGTEPEEEGKSDNKNFETELENSQEVGISSYNPFDIPIANNSSLFDEKPEEDNEEKIEKLENVEEPDFSAFEDIMEEPNKNIKENKETDIGIDNFQGGSIEELPDLNADIEDLEKKINGED